MCQFVEISNQMELNGEVRNFGYYNESHFYCNSQSFRLRHLAPFDWKFPQIGKLRAKDLRKNASILQKGGSTLFPHTQSVIRVVLLLTEAMRKDFWNPTVFMTFSKSLNELTHPNYPSLPTFGELGDGIPPTKIWKHYHLSSITKSTNLLAFLLVYTDNWSTPA